MHPESPGQHEPLGQHDPLDQHAHEPGPPRRSVHGAVSRWTGVALMLITSVATLWLAATGQLELYIHPRYTWFSIAMAIVGGVLAAAAIVVPHRDAAGRPLDDGHGHDAEPEPGRGRALLSTGGRLAVVAASALALIVLPPTALTAATAQGRELTDGASLDADPAALVGGDASSYTIRDWSVLLRQSGPDAVAGRELSADGYLVDIGEDDVVVIARLVITHCAIDAQPVGIPVYLPDWRADYGENAWVELEGAFRDNPDVASAEALAVVPTAVAGIDEPEQPYIF